MGAIGAIAHRHVGGHWNSHDCVAVGETGEERKKRLSAGVVQKTI